MRSRPEGLGIRVLPSWLAGGTAPESRPLGGISWEFIGGIAIFIAMLVGAYVLIRVMSGRGFGRQGRFFRVLDRFQISRDCMIVLLAAGSRVLVVCVGKDGGSLLCELDPEELEEVSSHSAEAPPKKKGDAQDGGFGKRFVYNMKRNTGVLLGVLPKDTPPMRPSSDKQPAAVKPETDFSALLNALQQSGAAQEDAAPRTADGAGANGAANYRAAVENMRRLAQTEAPAVRPASAPASPAGSAPASAGRAQSSDEETARELLRMLKDRKTPHETPKPAYTKSPAPETGPENQMDEILDKIARRQSRYSDPKSKPGSHNRKERS